MILSGFSKEGEGGTWWCLIKWQRGGGKEMFKAQYYHLIMPRIVLGTLLKSVCPPHYIKTMFCVNISVNQVVRARV